MLALAGDTSDNVPGVPGIGVKTAAQLLQEFGDLEGLLANAATIKQPKRRENLLEHAEQARISQRLVTLCDRCRRCPARSGRDGGIDYPGLLEFAAAHGFRSLAQRVELLADPRQSPRARPGTRARRRYATVTDFASLDVWLERATARGILALACTTTSPNVARAELVGLSLATGEGEACYTARAPGRLRHAAPASCRAARCWSACARCSRTRRCSRSGTTSSTTRACSRAMGSRSRPTTTPCSCPTCWTAPATATAWKSWPSCTSSTR